MERVTIEGWGKPYNLPWLQELYLIPITQVIPSNLHTDLPVLKQNATITKITFPPAGAFFDLAQENQTTYNIKVSVQMPGFAKAMHEFLKKYAAMEFVVIARDRNEMTWCLGNHEKGLKIVFQYTNNSRSIKSVDFSGKLSSLAVSQSDILIEMILQGEFSEEFSQEFS